MLNFLPSSFSAVRSPFGSVRVFCAPPLYYAVVKGDNAFQNEGYEKFWADPFGHRERLMGSWCKVVAELTRLGHEPLFPDLDPYAPDQLFGADSVIHFKNAQGRRAVLLSHMNSPDRQREVVAAEKLFRKHGYIIHQAHKNYKHEGTGDALNARDIGVIFTGYETRTDRDAGQHLANVTGKAVFALPLSSDFIRDKYDNGVGGLHTKDIEGFHLDVLAQPLPTGHVICYKPGLPRFALQALGFFYENLFNEDTRKFASHVIEVNEDDYKKFATNCFAVPDRNAPNGYTLFVPEDVSQELKDILSKRLGYRLFDVDIEVARWSGGGLHCMFNVEYDFSTPPTRNLNYLDKFLIEEWSNKENFDEHRRPVPGIRVFRPQPGPLQIGNTLEVA